jgi:vacuolar-type H+-ATPase subunit C/Vma6
MSRRLDNISFSLQETSKEANGKKSITYDDLLENVNLMEMTNSVMMDDYLALEIEYQTNYIKKELDRIADYYNIVKRKKKKDRLVEEIVIFEKDPDNMETVFRRKRMWSYVEEIKSDKYLSKFLILD